MEIKKADSKGRISVGQDGVPYSVERHENGSVTLHPIKLLSAVKPDFETMRAVYVEPSMRRSTPSTITIFSQVPTDPYEYVAKIANECKVPVVVNAAGIGVAWVDMLNGRVDRGVIERRP